MVFLILLKLFTHFPDTPSLHSDASSNIPDT